MNDIQVAKESLDKIIKKSKRHLYKLHTKLKFFIKIELIKNINLLDKETYRNISKKWRDVICIRFLGRVSTSSAKYQDDLFNDNAMPPKHLNILGEMNRKQMVE